MFDENRLRVFAAIAREGSVTAAAAALHYAQPSVSHHLARLEAEAGVPLVQRAGRGIRLTGAGRLLADRAEEILGRIDSARTELAAHAGLGAGRVRLAAFPSALAAVVPAVAAAFGAAHPDIELALTEAEPPEALAALRRGEVDVALTFHHGDSRPGDRQGHTVTPLLHEPLYVVSRAGGSWPGPRADLDTYRDQRWIAGCERCRTHLLSACGKRGFTPAVAFETDDYVAAQALVAAGLGVTTLPGLALRAHLHPGVRIDRLPDDHRFVDAVVYGAPPLPAPVAAFLEVLQETAARPLPWP
ncbi:LysR family transcriptional regulator [Streptomyces venezuelae]|uniref:LysR family transcriptional regulator n=1 Tax=Streptomyces venezuelae TaxID=54571 RepID=A0A5P2DV19_STRVZ|nr:LysR family transcriptional regulator [Streptomyces venezuelae]QES58187.1 LysR family transcriptional regulator [Streptomyces venezuelae]